MASAIEQFAAVVTDICTPNPLASGSYYFAYLNETTGTSAFAS